MEGTKNGGEKEGWGEWMMKRKGEREEGGMEKGWMRVKGNGEMGRGQRWREGG